MCGNRQFCSDLPTSATGLVQCSDCPECANLYNTTVYDFVDDATSAASYLQNTAGIPPAAMTVVGHSQGCSYVAEVAARTGSPNVVMLEGVGVGPGAVTSLQSEFQLPIFKNVLTYLKQAGASAADILAAEQQVGVTQCYAQYSVAQMDTVRDGTLAPWLTTNPLLNSFPVLTPAAVTDALYDALIAKGLNTTLLAEMGIAKGGVICPGANITGAPGCACDEAGVAKPKCELLCSGAQLAGNGPSVGFLFYSSWIDVGSLEYLKQSVLRLPANSRIMVC